MQTIPYGSHRKAEGNDPVRVTKKKTTSFEVVFLFVSPQSEKNNIFFLGCPKTGRRIVTIKSDN